MSVHENIYHPSVVTLYCPKCKERQEVQANMIHLDFMKTSVLRFLGFPDHCEIDWENADIEGDFEYICCRCGTKLADSLEDIENKLKEEEDGGSELSGTVEET